MSTVCSEPTIPTTVLRIPGPWRNVSELSARLPEGYQLRGDTLYSTDGPSLGFDILPADNEFASIFQSACRYPPKSEEWEQVAGYRMNAGIVGPGGSVLAAWYMIWVGAAIIRAGGAGVFIDNGAISHGGSDWLELATTDDPMAVSYAFVNLVGARQDYFTVGRHVLGQKDLFITRRGDETKNLRLLDDLIRDHGENQDKEPGETFRDCDGRSWRLVDEPHPLGGLAAPPHHPMHNPYGGWRVQVDG